MGIVIGKKKLEQTSVEELSPLAQIIDRYGAESLKADKIKKKIKEETAKLKPFKAVETELQEALEDTNFKDDEDGEINGTEFVLEFGPKGTSREVSNVRQVHEMLGDELFYKLASVKLTDLDKYLTLPQREKVITIERTKRSFKVCKRK